jgi:hypothetical protein
MELDGSGSGICLEIGSDTSKTEVRHSDLTEEEERVLSSVSRKSRPFQ